MEEKIKYTPNQYQHNIDILKKMFINDPNTLARMISDVTGISYHLLYNNIILLDKNEKPEKIKRCNFIARIDDSKPNLFSITLELNNYHKNKKYNKRIIITQINFDTSKENKNYKHIEDLKKCVTIKNSKQCI